MPRTDSRDSNGNQKRFIEFYNRMSKYLRKQDICFLKHITIVPHANAALDQ